MKSASSSPTSRLQPLALEPLPLGVVRPTGWLRDQLRVQANGLTGYLDEFWPSVAQSRWIGGVAEGWERGPYWLDGLIPLAVQLDDSRLLAKAEHWIDYILAHQHEDGWLGPKDDPHEGTGEVALDPWPHFVLFKALTQWEEARGDARIIPAMLRAARRIAQLLQEKPLRSWARMRWADLVCSLHRLYERTGEDWLLDLAETAHRQGYNWRSHFDSFRYTERTDREHLRSLSEEDCLPLHGVNNAMGVKTGAVWGRQSGDPLDTLSSLRAVDILDQYHGQVTGMFSGDEHLAGRDPIQGTETCTVTEYLFTLEQMLALTGEPELADRLERIAYNALPAAISKDMWTRQYDQQPNQVLCDIHRRRWVSNGAHSNIFSLEGNFGCCTANLHQGWPKFVASLWMGTRDTERQGITAVAYGPSTVTTTLNGVAVTITEETEYPFRGEIRFTVRAAQATAFPLSLRIPAWATDATVTINTEAPHGAKPDGYHTLDRTWRDGDTVILRLPMRLRYEPCDQDRVSFARGPLVLALHIGTEFQRIGGREEHPDWALHPTTPWNYAAVLEEEGETFALRQAALSAQPFNPDHAPVVVTIPARRLPDWELTDGCALLPPATLTADPVIESVELIPYGSTYLRISEFSVTNVAAETTLPLPATLRNRAPESEDAETRRTGRASRRQTHPSPVRRGNFR